MKSGRVIGLDGIAAVSYGERGGPVLVVKKNLYCMYKCCECRRIEGAYVFIKYPAESDN